VLSNRDDPPVEPAGRGRVVAALLLSLAGLGVAIYLTVDHFAKIPLACSDTGVINCQKVTTSGESYFFHIPVALLGLIFYTVMVAMNTPWAWRSTDRRVHLARLVLVCLGMGFALWLVTAEVLIIHNICLWCTSVHVITFALFVLLLATVPRMLGWGRLADDEWDDGEGDAAEWRDQADWAEEDGDAPRAEEDGHEGSGDDEGGDDGTGRGDADHVHA
jgi:uncharacterized membrane protein